MTGTGTAGHVISDPKRLQLMNMLLSEDQSLRLVKFHTHTLETARLYGDQFLRKFSQGDIDSYREQFAHDPEFIGMLITPEIELLCGLDNPTLEIIPLNDEILRERTRVEGMYHRLSTESGLEISPLKGRLA